MKKLFLFVAATALTLSLNSCSKSDSSSSAGKRISFKVNGVAKTFTNATAVESSGSIFVSAYVGPANNPTETVQFVVASTETGTGAMYNFDFSNDTDDYYSGDAATFPTNVTTNSTTSLKGTFSGTLHSSTSETLAVTEGSFDINR